VNSTFNHLKKLTRRRTRNCTKLWRTFVAWKYNQ